MMRIVIVESIKRLQLAYELNLRCTLSPEYTPQVSRSKYDTLKNQTTEPQNSKFYLKSNEKLDYWPQLWMVSTIHWINPQLMVHLLNNSSTCTMGSDVLLFFIFFGGVVTKICPKESVQSTSILIHGSQHLFSCFEILRVNKHWPNTHSSDFDLRSPPS